VSARARLVAALAIAMATAAPAAAQPAGGEEQARVLYAEGRRHYDLAEWDQAIASFKEAYTAYAEPLFLFNIAQAYRQKGDCAGARTFYKSYLRNATDAEIAAEART